MAPPWEPWAVLIELPRRLKKWLARPLPDNGARAASGSRRGETAAPSLVEDSSDLLRRRMKALDLDPDDVDRPVAQLSGIKTGLCERCAARGKCIRGLDDEFTDPGWGDWRNYCPNATTLTILSTLGNCVDEKQHPDSQGEPDAAGRWACSTNSGDQCSRR